MSDWGPRTFGDPCAECGFDWSSSADAAVGLIERAPDEYMAVLASASGAESARGLAWNVVAYVAHVADNLRIWGERLAALNSESPVVVVPYDSEALAAARSYATLPLGGVLWGMTEASHAWARAWRSADRAMRLEHPDRGSITVDDVARTNAHDVAHHLADIRQCLAETLPGAGSA